jgi:hypothetical protein
MPDRESAKLRDMNTHRHALAAVCGLSIVACGVAFAAEPTISLSIDGLARTPVTGESHGKQLACEGVALNALLERDLGRKIEGLRGADLASTVRISARDGYRVVFTLAELDPTIGGLKAYVVDRCDGAPLADDVGPLRLMVPSDHRPARWIRQIESIEFDRPAAEK